MPVFAAFLSHRGCGCQTVPIVSQGGGAPFSAQPANPSGRSSAKKTEIHLSDSTENSEELIRAPQTSRFQQITANGKN
jgi:hypothetical protein